MNKNEWNGLGYMCVCASVCLVIFNLIMSEHRKQLKIIISVYVYVI